MMHIIATNACIVIRTLVKESSKEMMGHDDNAKTSNGTSLDHLAHPKCQRIEIIGEAIESSSVYLYPFIIEYSIIGISVVYRYYLLSENSSAPCLNGFSQACGGILVTIHAMSYWMKEAHQILRRMSLKSLHIISLLIFEGPLTGPHPPLDYSQDYFRLSL